ncbi:MAG TPA: nodulation protein NfeD, partial [Firmicutes bacterium]|nr:nodulation protein NfeD [Bacillota bacterium]
MSNRCYFRFLRITLILLVVLMMLPVAASPLSAGGKTVITASIEGTITPGKLVFLERKIRDAEKTGAELLVIILDTPGGLVDATISINSAILNAELPVAVLVAPPGAIAASAGSFIVLSSDIAAMAPGTTIGAAQPVTLSPEGVEEAGDKTTKFLSKHLHNLANEKGRPPEIAERFVTENLTLSAREAYEEGVIDYLASNLSELLEQLHGQTVHKHDRKFILDTANPVIET